MAKYFYQVVKDGQILGVRSSNREYTHAVVHWNTHREVRGQVIRDKHVAHIEYCGRLGLAQKKLGAAHREAEIVELTVTKKGGAK